MRRLTGLLVTLGLTAVVLAPAPERTEAAWSDTSAGALTGCSRVWDWSVYRDFTGVGDWDGDGANDIVSLGRDGTLQLHPGRGNGQFDCSIVMGKAPVNTRTITGLELSAGREPTLFAVASGTSASGRAEPAYTATPAILALNGKRQAVSEWQESFQTGWNVFETGSLIAAPGLEQGQSTLAGKWSRTGKSNFFTYRINAANQAMSAVGSPNGADTNPGLFGWDEWFPGDSVLGLGDWDGDGHGDIGAISGPDAPGATVGRLLIYRGDGTGARALIGSGLDGGDGWDSITKSEGGHDYTGDGRPDIIGVDSATGHLLLWRWIGAGPPAAPVRTY